MLFIAKRGYLLWSIQIASSSFVFKGTKYVCVLHNCLYNWWPKYESKQLASLHHSVHSHTGSCRTSKVNSDKLFIFSFIFPILLKRKASFLFNTCMYRMHTFNIFFLWLSRGDWLIPGGPFCRPCSNTTFTWILTSPTPLSCVHVHREAASVVWFLRGISTRVRDFVLLLHLYIRGKADRSHTGHTADDG